MKKFAYKCLFAFLFLFSQISYGTANDIRILIGSPIRQKPKILHEFLESLKRLNSNGISFDYYFKDDNIIEKSHQILEKFSKEAFGKCIIDKPEILNTKPIYDCKEVTHNWTDEAVWRVAGLNKMIDYAQAHSYDYIFLIDSDIVLHPNTIQQLLKAKKDIVSNIFWTPRTPVMREMPQVWLYDYSTAYEKKHWEKLTKEEIDLRTAEFCDMLKKPGVYEVGGVGTCTLISKKTLEKGINFVKMKNLSFQGEDRHFCARAVALDFKLFVDTHLPAYHIYKESKLVGVNEFVTNCEKTPTPTKEPRITLSMIMKNEADRYLRPMLENAKQYITDAVIIDDGSSDNSVALAKEILKDIPLVLIENKESKFANEITLRKQQWEETVKTNPDWIMCLDADELMEDKFKDEVKKLVRATDTDAYLFRLYDFWNETHYRDDKYWCGHNYYYTFLIRYNPSIEYQWQETPQHCSRLPRTVKQFRKKFSSLRMKHYGWSRESDRIAKYKRYMTLDPSGKHGWLKQYESILDKNPHLVEWVE